MLIFYADDADVNIMRIIRIFMRMLLMKSYPQSQHCILFVYQHYTVRIISIVSSATSALYFQHHDFVFRPFQIFFLKNQFLFRLGFLAHRL